MFFKVFFWLRGTVRRSRLWLSLPQGKPGFLDHIQPVCHRLAVFGLNMELAIQEVKRMSTSVPWTAKRSVIVFFSHLIQAIGSTALNNFHAYVYLYYIHELFIMCYSVIIVNELNAMYIIVLQVFALSNLTIAMLCLIPCSAYSKFKSSIICTSVNCS